MTDRNQARESLADELTKAGRHCMVKPKMPGIPTYFKGPSHKLFLETSPGNYAIIFPEEIHSIEQVREMKETFKEIKDCDGFNPAYFKSGGTEIQYATSAIGNTTSFCSGKFYGFDEENALTRNLFTILSVIKSHERLKKDLGVLLNDNVYNAEDLNSRPFEAKPDETRKVEAWLKQCRIQCYDNLDSNPEFQFSHKGILIVVGNKKHFVIVSDGQDKDLARTYVETREMRNNYDNSGLIFQGNNCELESIVIASPHSIQGHLFANDKMKLSGQKVEHTDSRDFMPRDEYAKSFQFCRLPFFLYRPGQKRPFVNTLLSTALDGKSNPGPLISTIYLDPYGNPGHKISNLAASHF